jgi:membrane protease subunit HflC
MKRNTLTLVIGILLLLVFAFMLFSFQVRQTEVALVTTFGKPTREETQPGLKYKWPWPIQKVQTFDKRIHNFEDKTRETLTKDGINLLVNVYAGWNISNPKIFRERFNDSMARAETDLRGLISSAKNAVVGQHPFSHFISTDPGQLKFTDIEKEMLEQVKPAALANYGIEVQFLGINKLELPESITQKVFDRMTAERQRFVEKLQAEGERESINIRSAADRDRAQILAAADAQATQIRGEAEREAAKYYAAFEQNPELYLFLQKLKALEASLKDRATLILDQRTPPYDLLNGLKYGNDKK